ncbi:MAG: shikimate kinase [Hansschlegelia sp.]
MQRVDDGAPAGPEQDLAPLPDGPDASAKAAAVRAALGRRSVILVGMMGAGKTSVGRRLAQALSMPFVDADAEIEARASRTVAEIFEQHGEAYFRAGEARVIARLLADRQMVLATGGGAWMNPETRRQIAEAGVSIWLRAEFDVLLRRVRKRNNRPLLASADPEATLKALMETRYPVYALADLTVISRDAPHERVVAEVIAALYELFCGKDGVEAGS